MTKIQPVKFRSTDDFLEFLEGPEKLITEELRRITLSALPDIQERLSYNVPFYSRFKRICYIWPASIPWGGLKSGDGVAFGFCQGDKIRHGGYLETGTRKYVRIRRYQSLKEIDSALLVDLLAEAYEIDVNTSR